MISFIPPGKLKISETVIRLEYNISVSQILFVTQKVFLFVYNVFIHLKRKINNKTLQILLKVFLCARQLALLYEFKALSYLS